MLTVWKTYLVQIHLPANLMYTFHFGTEQSNLQNKGITNITSVNCIFMLLSMFQVTTITTTLPIFTQSTLSPVKEKRTKDQLYLWEANIA